MKCQGKTQSGKACKNHKLVDDLYCSDHSQLPEYREKRKQRSILGGQKAIRNLPKFKGKIETTKDYHAFLSLVLTEVAHGKAKPSDTQLKTIRALGKSFMEADHMVTVIDRLQKLEDKKI